MDWNADSFAGQDYTDPDFIQMFLNALNERYRGVRTWLGSKRFDFNQINGMFEEPYPLKFNYSSEPYQGDKINDIWNKIRRMGLMLAEAYVKLPLDTNGQLDQSRLSGLDYNTLLDLKKKELYQSKITTTIEQDNQATDVFVTTTDYLWYNEDSIPILYFKSRTIEPAFQIGSPDIEWDSTIIFTFYSGPGIALYSAANPIISWAENRRVTSFSNNLDSASPQGLQFDVFYTDLDGNLFLQQAAGDPAYGLDGDGNPNKSPYPDIQGFSISGSYTPPMFSPLTDERYFSPPNWEFNIRRIFTWGVNNTTPTAGEIIYRDSSGRPFENQNDLNIRFNFNPVENTVARYLGGQSDLSPVLNYGSGRLIKLTNTSDSDDQPNLEWLLLDKDSTESLTTILTTGLDFGETGYGGEIYSNEMFIDLRNMINAMVWAFVDQNPLKLKLTQVRPAVYPGIIDPQIIQWSMPAGTNYSYTLNANFQGTGISIQQAIDELNNNWGFVGNESPHVNSWIKSGSYTKSPITEIIQSPLANSNSSVDLNAAETSGQTVMGSPRLLNFPTYIPHEVVWLLKTMAFNTALSGTTISTLIDFSPPNPVRLRDETWRVDNLFPYIGYSNQSQESLIDGQYTALTDWEDSVAPYRLSIDFTDPNNPISFVSEYRPCVQGPLVGNLNFPATQPYIFNASESRGGYRVNDIKAIIKYDFIYSLNTQGDGFDAYKARYSELAESTNNFPVTP